MSPGISVFDCLVTLYDFGASVKSGEMSILVTSESFCTK